LTSPWPGAEGNPTFPEGLIAVVWSASLGPGLVITPTRILGSNLSNWKAYCEVYLGPNSKATASDRDSAYSWAGRLVEQKVFELPKESIRTILYRRPSYFSRGHVIFKTNSEEKFVLIGTTTSDVGVRKTLQVLVPALEAFAQDRLYNEKTGNLLINDIQEKGFWKV